MENIHHVRMMLVMLLIKYQVLQRLSAPDFSDVFDCTGDADVREDEC